MVMISKNSTLYENPITMKVIVVTYNEEIDTTGEAHSDGKDHKYVVQTSIGPERGTPKTLTHHKLLTLWFHKCYLSYCRIS